MSGGPPWEIGIDGHPVSPDHPSNRDKRTVEEIDEHIFRREMRNCERAWMDGNNFKALSKAVSICGTERPLPAWVSKAVLSQLDAHFNGRSAGKKRGRTGNAKAANRQNQIHFARWDAVVEIKDRWNEIAEKGDGRFSLEKAFAKASEILASSEAAGDDEAIKKSYQLVQQLSKSGKGARFYIP